jgi:prepilin-type N-terminal cleavage/methylation domain-containing protein
MRHRPRRIPIRGSVRGCARGSIRDRGYTIIELLVAMMVLAVGMLGLAATAVAVARLSGGGMRQTIAAAVARSRFELLRSGGCARVSSGAAVIRGVHESWTARARGVRVFEVTDSVRFVASSARREETQTFRSLVRC